MDLTASVLHQTELLAADVTDLYTSRKRTRPLMLIVGRNQLIDEVIMSEIVINIKTLVL